MSICLSQLLSNFHEINSSFECDPILDLRSIFLDISKAFVPCTKGFYTMHEGLLLKLKTYVVKGELLYLLQNYLHERNQIVVLNGQISSQELIKYVMPQGSVLGSLWFLIYINDLPDNIQFICKIFANDTSLFSHVFDTHKSQSGLSNDLKVISNQAFLWKMQFNPDPNKQAQEVYFSKKSNNENSLPITFNNAEVVTFSTHKHLGLLLHK